MQINAGKHSDSAFFYLNKNICCFNDCAFTVRHIRWGGKHIKLIISWLVLLKLKSKLT